MRLPLSLLFALLVCSAACTGHEYPDDIDTEEPAIVAGGSDVSGADAGSEDATREPAAAPGVAASAGVGAGGTGGAQKQPSDSTVVEVGKDRIGAREIVDMMIQRHRRVFDGVVQELLIRRVVKRERAIHTIVIPSKLVDADVARDEEKAERFSQLQYQMSFLELLKRQGRTIDQFRAVSREKSIHTHSLHRLVRHAQLRKGLLKVRHIVVSEQAEAEAVRAKLVAGAEFAKMARQHSLCPTKTSGGELAMIVPGLYASAKHAQVEDALWKLKSGQLSPVVEAKTGFHVFEALYREVARDLPYAKVEALVGESLKQWTVMDEEVEWWLQQIRPRYPIKQHFK